MKRHFPKLALLAAVVAASTPFSGCKSDSLSRSVNASNGKAGTSLKDAPSVTFKDLHGADITLASLKGKVVLVNFWATWCEPCRAEIPWLIEFQRKYASKGFTVLGIAMDEEGQKVVQPWVQTTTFDVDGQPTLVNYPIVIGDDAIADKFGGLWAFPDSFLVTRDGKIAKKYIGEIQRESMEKEIEALLGS